MTDENRCSVCLASETALEAPSRAAAGEYGATIMLGFCGGLGVEREREKLCVHHREKLRDFNGLIARLAKKAGAA